MTFLRSRLRHILADTAIVVVSLLIAYGIRFEGIPTLHYQKQIVLLLPYVVILRILLLMVTGTYRLVWRYVSLRDVPRIAIAIGLGTALLVALRFGCTYLVNKGYLLVDPHYATIPYGVLLVELVLTGIGIVGARAIWRTICERSDGRPGAVRYGRQKALLVGAGSMGVMVARESWTNSDAEFEVKGFLDDDPQKHQALVYGIPVLGGTHRFTKLVAEHQIDLVVLTMSSPSPEVIRRVVKAAQQARVQVKILPAVSDILTGRVNFSNIREVRLEDLLGRAPVELETASIETFLSRKSVLVTGAGGSIGSEICRQVSRFKPSRLILLDHAENPLFHLQNELNALELDSEIVTVIASVTDKERIRTVLREQRPRVVFHAAAHKHVSLMEQNPTEAIRNNVRGTRYVADAVEECGAEAFVMISTDKAVNPTSVMGASKRAAEIYVQSLAQRSKGTRFLTVRFGNVLGSEGSVVPLFKQQIARGGPITITHAEMRRYFMTIPEASQLVLQSATMGEGGEVFILDMGEPVKIINLARDLIRLSGLQPEDIEIVFKGIRRGEKLYEEINLSEEVATKTRHPRIWIGTHRKSDPGAAVKMVEQLCTLVDTCADGSTVRTALTHAVPEYTGAQFDEPPTATVVNIAHTAATAELPLSARDSVVREKGTLSV